MLEAITWKQFIIGVASATFLWYVAVILIYYRKELIAFIRRSPGNEDASYDELEDLVLEIRHSILEEAGKDATKQELVELLKARMVSYSGLRVPVLRDALNNRIIKDAEEICGVSFSEQELEQAWIGLPR